MDPPVCPPTQEPHTLVVHPPPQTQLDASVPPRSSTVLKPASPELLGACVRGGCANNRHGRMDCASSVQLPAVRVSASYVPCSKGPAAGDQREVWQPHQGPQAHKWAWAKEQGVRLGVSCIDCQGGGVRTWEQLYLSAPHCAAS